MTRAYVGPSLEDVIKTLAARIDRLERAQGVRIESGLWEIQFDQPGSLFVDSSAPYPLRDGGVLMEVQANLGTAGSSTTTVSIRKRGTAVCTLTLSSGSTSAQSVLSSPVNFGPQFDTLTVAVTGAGTSAADLTVVCRFK